MRTLRASCRASSLPSRQRVSVGSRTTAISGRLFWLIQRFPILLRPWSLSLTFGDRLR